jgi:RecA-family ATPase
MGRDEVVRPTSLFEQLRRAALAIRPKLIFLDNVADIYSGNENARSPVRQFVTLIRGIAVETDAAVVMSLHPSIRGQETQTGMSGSTAWFNSVRSQLYLKRPETKSGEACDPDVRELEAKKNNYGPLAEAKRLRWKDGVFVLDRDERTALSKDADDRNAEEVFLKLLKLFTSQNRKVSVSPSRSYAPVVFASHAEREGITKPQFEQAMERLLVAGAIRNVTEGPPSKQRSRLAPA